MLKAAFVHRLLRFAEPVITSRGALTAKETWYVKVWRRDDPTRYGIGECALFRGLSAEDGSDYEQRLAEACARVNEFSSDEWRDRSSICFGMETALADLQQGGARVIFPSSFASGQSVIEINGLVWMGSREQMTRRVREKLAAGFRCIKLKIGGVDFREEVAILREIRARFSADELQLRLDANGAFTPRDVFGRLDELARFDIHSIEQPIRQGAWKEMSRVALHSPIPVALDEELIGVSSRARKVELLDAIAPAYIVLKPSLAGGFASCDEWIELANARSIGWWATSALESNIGLNAIAQWCFTRGGIRPAGLGTGGLYLNNIPSPLAQRGCFLSIDPCAAWNAESLF
jgi:o-succinylbenzoate synthase